MNQSKMFPDFGWPGLILDGIQEGQHSFVYRYLPIRLICPEAGYSPERIDRGEVIPFGQSQNE